MNECEKNTEIVIPDPLPDFNSEANIGTWKQLLASNIGKKVKAEISLFDGTLRTLCGEVYLVGGSYFGLRSGSSIVFGDIYALKLVTFY